MLFWNHCIRQLTSAPRAATWTATAWAATTWTTATWATPTSGSAATAWAATTPAASWPASRATWSWTAAWSRTTTPPTTTWTWWPSVPVLEILAVSWKMTLIATLVASHARIKPAPSHTLCPWPCNSYPNSSTANFFSIRAATRLMSIILVLKHNKCKTGRRFGHPNFEQRPELFKALLDVAFLCPAVQVGNV